MPDDLSASPSRPLAPDFATHGLDVPLSSLDSDGAFLTAQWSDGISGRFHALWLRENEVRDGIVDDVTRERSIEIDQLPLDTRISSARQIDGPAVEIAWCDGQEISRFDPGWLRTVALGLWRADADIPAQIPWQASEMPEPPTFDGPDVLNDDGALHAFLSAAWESGFARLRGLPVDSGTVQRVGERIGTVRSSNFGFLFSVETKPDPDSTAYTAVSLDGHTDLATRETQPGLQLLHCRENSATGGASTMADGFAVAEAMRSEAPEDFEAITTLSWLFTNRHRDTDYRFAGPIVALNDKDQVVEIRNTGFLRAFPDMDDADIPRAYRALQRFTAHCRSSRFLCKTPFAEGDLVLFDNRRMLHGRDSFDPQSGTRRLEGCYLDRDEILSRLRVLARRARAS